jgi:hypothetical protein
LKEWFKFIQSFYYNVFADHKTKIMNFSICIIPTVQLWRSLTPVACRLSPVARRLLPVACRLTPFSVGHRASGVRCQALGVWHQASGIGSYTCRLTPGASCHISFIENLYLYTSCKFIYQFKIAALWETLKNFVSGNWPKSLL